MAETRLSVHVYCIGNVKQFGLHLKVLRSSSDLQLYDSESRLKER